MANIPPPPDDPRKLAGALPAAAPGAIPPPPDNPSALAPAAPAQRGAIGKAWDALAVPEAKSREGLDAVARAVKRNFPEPADYTGNLPVDLALHGPKVAAESVAETAAKVAPAFVSRGAIVTAGALKGAQMAAPVGRALARAAEGWSGLEYKNAGILREAANDSSLLFAPGKDKAASIYAAATDRANVLPEVKAAMTHGELVSNAKKALEAGTLNPDSALAARQSLDAIKKTMPRGNYLELRDAFDKVAKTISAEADAVFSRGLKADALRTALPVNKGGGTSIMKSAIGTMLGKVGLPLMSPAVQGAVATGVGAAARNPVPVATIAGPGRDLGGAIMRRLQTKKEAK
jgi:hypothetical protein